MVRPNLATVMGAIGRDLGRSSINYDERDVALYALGIGAPADSLDPDELKFVYELSSQGFQVLPTFAVTFSRAMIARLLTGELAGIRYDPMMLVHGEQRLEVLQPLPPAAKVHTRARIADIHDKGSGMLVIVDIESCMDDGAPLALARMSAFIRGLGGFGGERGQPSALILPERLPDVVHEEKTLVQQALLYRLAGDANPLHADPHMAALGNYDKPILHGLCTFGFAARAILKRWGGNDAKRLRAISARFAGHVFPGETLISDMWQLSPGEIAFQTRVKERPAIALSHARARLEP